MPSANNCSEPRSIAGRGFLLCQTRRAGRERYGVGFRPGHPQGPGLVRAQGRRQSRRPARLAVGAAPSQPARCQPLGEIFRQQPTPGAFGLLSLWSIRSTAGPRKVSALDRPAWPAGISVSSGVGVGDGFLGFGGFSLSAGPDLDRKRRIRTVQVSRRGASVGEGGGARMP